MSNTLLGCFGGMALGFSAMTIVLRYAAPSIKDMGHFWLAYMGMAFAVPALIFLMIGLALITARQ